MLWWGSGATLHHLRLGQKVGMVMFILKFYLSLTQYSVSSLVLSILL